MDAKLNALIHRARAEHRCQPGATAVEISEAEQRLGYEFTPALRELLRACNGILFWEAGPLSCRLLSAREIQPTHALLGGEQGPGGIVAIIEVEADVVAMDLDPESKSYSRLIDCSHETFPHELYGICDSVEEVLTLILDSKGDEWTWPAVRKYGLDFAA